MFRFRFRYAAAVLLAALPAGSGTAAGTVTVDRGMIAFASARASGAFELYTMRADGARQRRLTSNQPTAAFAAWSPNGRRLAYINRALGELWVMRADGTQPRRVTPGLRVTDFYAPTWSPDGRRLAVVARRMGHPGIWIVNLQTERVRRLTAGLFDSSPAWSPNGRQIVFTRPSVLESRQYDDELYAIAPTGGTPKRLTRTPRIEESAPSWSRDGRLAFAAQRGDRFDLFVMNANGSGRHAVTTTSTASESDPDWSPDGTKLAFHDSERAGRLFTVNLDGNDEREFEVATSAPMDPDWSPNGSRIVFSNSWNTTWSLELRSGRVRVLKAGRTDSSPAWSPDGQRLAFSRDSELHILHLRDGRVTQIADGRNPSWSPDGTRIAVEDMGNDGISLFRANGSGERESVLADEGIGDTDKVDPAWSPDGGRLAYTDSNDNFVKKQVCILRLARPRTRRCVADGSSPNWSPDGRMLVYRCSRGICTMQANGRDKRKLASWGGGPRFSADGRRIVYAVPRGHTAAIYVMNADGSKKRQLTQSRWLSLAPDWQPLRR